MKEAIPLTADVHVHVKKTDLLGDGVCENEYILTNHNIRSECNHFEVKHQARFIHNKICGVREYT